MCGLGAGGSEGGEEGGEVRVSVWAGSRREWGGGGWGGESQCVGWEQEGVGGGGWGGESQCVGWE